MADELSLDQVRSAFYDVVSPRQPSQEEPRLYVKEVYTDHLIAEKGGQLFKVPFSMGDEGIEFGDMTEVRIEYVPVKMLKALFGKMVDFFRPAEGEKAKWTTAYMNNLPDSAFLWIEAGGKKDEGGKTTPRSLRHFPVKGADGKFDLPHVRNAIARIPQAKDKNGNKISEGLATRLQAKARGILKRLRKKMPEGFSGFKTYEQEDGRLRWVSWTSNAFVDREGEIFTTKALEDYAVRAMTEDNHGALWIGHFPLKVGTPDVHIVFGRFLVESGLFDESEHGQKAAAYLAAYEEPLEMSHGYRYVEEDRDDKVYEWVDIKERSVLPAGTAANLWTSMATIVEEVKAMSMPDAVVQMVKDALGEDMYKELKGNTEAITKALEAAGIDFKSLTEEEPPDPEAEKKEEETKDVTIPAEVEAAFAEAKKDFDALAAKVEPLVGLPKAIEELTAKVEALAKSDAEKIKALAEEETPRAALWRASQAEETKVSEEEADVLGEPKVSKVVQQIAARIAGGAG